MHLNRETDEDEEEVSTGEAGQEGVGRVLEGLPEHLLTCPVRILKGGGVKSAKKKIWSFA